MKFKFLIFNLALVVFITGMFSAVLYGFKPVFTLTVLASVIIIVLYAYLLIKAFKKGKFWPLTNLLILLLNLVIAVIFVHGLTLSIDRYLLNDYPSFKVAYSIAGNLLIIMFLVVSIIWIYNTYKGSKQKIFIAAHILIAVPLLIGINGITGNLPIHEKWLGIGVLLHCGLLLGYNIYKAFYLGGRPGSGILIIIVCSFLLITLSIFKYFFNEVYGFNIYKTILYVAFVPLFALPLGILFIKRFQIFHIVLPFLALIDLYAIHTMGSNYYYYVYYGVKRIMDVPVKTILTKPTTEELAAIRNEWQTMKFESEDVQIVFQKIRANGDTIKVVSHLVEGTRHYGIIKIPKGLDVKRAPILMVLGGGGAHGDIRNEDFLYVIAGEKSKLLLDSFLTITPVYRGNMLKINNRLFLAGGQERDAFYGAAIDAISFLEAVKAMYNKDKDTRVLGYGTSKGATIALMIGGLTNYFDQVIAVSAYTNFLAHYMVVENRVAGYFENAFYTRELTIEKFRKRIIACSPYFYAENLPPVDLHHGADDEKINVWHAIILGERLHEYGIIDSLYNIYTYEERGHTYFDEVKVCQRIKQFLEVEKD